MGVRALTASVVLLLLGGLSVTASSGALNKGVGPIKKVQLGPIDQALAAKGQAVWESKCSACHKLDERYVGPQQNGVTRRRSPEWIMNMILNPQEMVEQDPVAQELLAEYLTFMPFQDVSEQDARAILEFFRLNDAALDGAVGAPGRKSKKSN